MCDPLTLGLILSAVGTGTQVANNQISAKRQDREAARGIRRQGELQKEANNRVNEQIDELAASDGSAERGESLAGFQQAIRESQGQAQGALPGDALVVGANPRFAEKVTQGQTQIRQGADERAGRMSIIDAALAQRMNEGSRMGRTATDLNEQNRRSRAEDFITQLRIADRRPNEWVNALGTILQGAGSAVSLGAGFGGANLGKMAKAGTLVDSVNTVNPYAAAARGVFV